MTRHALATYLVCSLVALGGCEASEDSASQEPTDLGDIVTDAADVPAVADVAAAIDAKPWPAVPPSFQVGGLIGRYTPGVALTPTDVPLDLPPTHLHESLRLSDGEGAFALMFDDGPFCGRVQGGIHVEKTTTYTFTAVGGDSVQVRLDGIPVITAWATQEVSTESVDLVLEKGWHPIEIIFSSDPFRAVLELWVAEDGGFPEVVEGDALGYASKVPEGTPVLWGSVEVGNPTPYGVDVTYQATGPARLKIDTIIDGQLSTVTSPHLGIEGELHVSLQPGSIAELDFSLYDAWGRVATLQDDLVFAPGLPNFEPGGILGTYYEQNNHTELLATRLDLGIVLPEAAGEGTGGSFGMPTSGDTFSVRWDGGIYASVAGEYTLYWGTDDGARVFLDGQLLADDWTNHPPQYVSPTAHLEKGWHTLKLEMYENFGGAYAHLEWAGPGFVRHVTPPEVLGSVLPPDDETQPAVVEAEVFTSWQNNIGGRAVLWIRTTELATAEVIMTTADDAVSNHEFETFSTGFRRVFDGLPSGPILFYIYLTDRHGDSSPTTKTVFGEVPEPPEDP